jgi:hypothetical protein
VCSLQQALEACNDSLKALVQAVQARPMTLQPVHDADNEQQSQTASAVKTAVVITLPQSAISTVQQAAVSSAEQQSDSSSSGDTSATSSDSVTVADKSARLAPSPLLPQVAAALREVFAILRCSNASSDTSMFGWTWRLAQPPVNGACAITATTTTAGSTAGVAPAGAEYVSSNRNGAGAVVSDIVHSTSSQCSIANGTGTAADTTAVATGVADDSIATAVNTEQQQQQQQCTQRRWRMPTVLMAGPTPQAQCVRSSISVATAAASALLSTLLKLEALTVNRTATSGQRKQYVSTLHCAPVLVRVLGAVLVSLERFLRGRCYCCCCGRCNATTHSSGADTSASSESSELQQCAAAAASTAAAATSSVKCRCCNNSTSSECEYSVSAAAVGDAYWQFVTAERRAFVAKLNCVLGSFSTCALYSTEAVNGRRKSYDDALTEVLQFVTSRAAREGFAALSAMRS